MKYLLISIFKENGYSKLYIDIEVILICSLGLITKFNQHRYKKYNINQYS